MAVMNETAPNDIYPYDSEEDEPYDIELFCSDEAGFAIENARWNLQCITMDEGLWPSTAACIDHLVTLMVDKKRGQVVNLCQEAPELMLCVYVFFINTLLKNGMRDFVEKKLGQAEDEGEVKKWRSRLNVLEEWMEKAFEGMDDNLRRRLTATEYPVGSTEEEQDGVLRDDWEALRGFHKLLTDKFE